MSFGSKPIILSWEFHFLKVWSCSKKVLRKQMLFPTLGYWKDQISPPKTWPYFKNGYLLYLTKCSHLLRQFTIWSLQYHLMFQNFYHHYVKFINLNNLIKEIVTKTRRLVIMMNSWRGGLSLSLSLLKICKNGPPKILQGLPAIRKRKKRKKEQYYINQHTGAVCHNRVTYGWVRQYVRIIAQGSVLEAGRYLQQWETTKWSIDWEMCQDAL